MSGWILLSIWTAECVLSKWYKHIFFLQSLKRLSSIIESIKEWTVDTDGVETNNNVQRVHAIPTVIGAPFEQPQQQPINVVQLTNPNADAAIIHDDRGIVQSQAQLSDIRPSQQAQSPSSLAFGTVAHSSPVDDEISFESPNTHTINDEKSSKRREMMKKINRLREQQLQQQQQHEQQLAQRPICPDGGEPLVETNGLQRVCGAGFDGVAFCPPGYYCSIDVELEQRLCCPLVVLGSRIHPPTPIKQPFLAMRPSNPGEVIGAGSLPSDRLPALANSETALQSSGDLNIQFCTQ